VVNKDLVSVIIPAYNAEKYIKECVNSILNQTYTHIEIIVVNDGSSDNTLHILNSIKDYRLKIISQPNRGCSAAKNIGLANAKGDFIQYLDADDFLSPDKIENQIQVLHNLSQSIAVCKTVIFGSNSKNVFCEIDTNLIKKGGSGIEFLLRLLGSEGKRGMVQPNAYLLPKTISDKIGNWNTDLIPSPDEDSEYFARALLVADRVFFTEGINFYRKTFTHTSLSQLYSFERINNLLQSENLKFKQIFVYEQSKLTEKLFQLNISQIAYQFGVQYPAIILNAQNLLRGSRFKKLKVKSPFLFSLISGLIGFKLTMKIKHFFQIIFNSYQ
jgi:glycosyltransferase involved in cell wall biosynthesis